MFSFRYVVVLLTSCSSSYTASLIQFCYIFCTNCEGVQLTVKVGSTSDCEVLPCLLEFSSILVQFGVERTGIQYEDLTVNFYRE